MKEWSSIDLTVTLTPRTLLYFLLYVLFICMFVIFKITLINFYCVSLVPEKSARFFSCIKFFIYHCSVSDPGQPRHDRLMRAYRHRSQLRRGGVRLYQAEACPSSVLSLLQLWTPPASGRHADHGPLDTGPADTCHRSEREWVQYLARRQQQVKETGGLATQAVGRCSTAAKPEKQDVEGTSGQTVSSDTGGCRLS